MKEGMAARRKTLVSIDGSLLYAFKFFIDYSILEQQSLQENFQVPW